MKKKKFNYPVKILIRASTSTSPSLKIQEAMNMQIFSKVSTAVQQMFPSFTVKSEASCFHITVVQVESWT